VIRLFWQGTGNRIMSFGQRFDHFLFKFSLAFYINIESKLTDAADMNEFF